MLSRCIPVVFGLFNLKFLGSWGKWRDRILAYDWLETIEKINGMAEGIDHPETARMYPHLFKGRDNLVKFRYLENRPAKTLSKGTTICGAKKWWQEFAKKHLKITLGGVLENLWGRTLFGTTWFTRFCAK